MSLLLLVLNLIVVVYIVRILRTEDIALAAVASKGSRSPGAFSGTECPRCAYRIEDHGRICPVCGNTADD